MRGTHKKFLQQLLTPGHRACASRSNDTRKHLIHLDQRKRGHCRCSDAMGKFVHGIADADLPLARFSGEIEHTDFNLGQGPNAAQADNTIKMIYGPDGMNAYTGTVGDKMIMSFGLSDAVLGSTIAAVKANEDPIGKLPGVAAVNAQLPKSRMISLYIPLDEIVTTAGTYAGAMGMPIQIQLPPDLPPIGVTAGTEGSAVRIDSFTSTDLIKALVAQGMQLYMQRMGAGAPGGPGGL